VSFVASRHFHGRANGFNRLVRLTAGGLLVWTISLLGSSANAQGPNSNYGHGFGTVSLAPGQTQQVWIGAGYQLLRVCIDLETAGTAVVTIDDQLPRTLGPGLCTEDFGNTIDMSNHSGSTATIDYRTIFEPPPE
jgi:hypothetical protein